MFELAMLLLLFVVCLVITSVYFIKKHSVAVDEHVKLTEYLKEQQKKYDQLLSEKMQEIDKLRVDYKELTKVNEDNVSELKKFDDFAKKYVQECEDFIKNYNEFYSDTLEDVASVLNMMDDLMKRQVITDDPDVQNFYRIVQVLHDVLIGYTNAGNRGIDPKKES